MIHLAKINAGLSDAERHVLADALHGRDAEALTAELLRLSVDDAITIVSARIAQLRVVRESAGARAAHAGDQTARDATRRPATETEATEPAVPMAAEGSTPTAGADADATARDFMRHVLAVAAFLDADRRAANGETAGTDLVPWIDALALTLAAGLRVGAAGLERLPAAAAAGDPEVMDADQLAAFLGVDRKTVYDYAGRGESSRQRLGKRLLFSRTAMVGWLGARGREARR